MKVMKNAEHNSIEIDFEEVRALMKAYGFWWFGKSKVWCHTLEIDGEFFEKFVEERIRPLCKERSVSKEQIDASVAAMSEEEKQALLALLMGQ